MVKGWKKRPLTVREAALGLYLEGVSDYENASRSGVSIYTIETWKRLFGWRERRVSHRLSIKGGVHGIFEVSYHRKWKSKGKRSREETQGPALEAPDSELKTRSGRRRGKKAWEPEAKKKMTKAARRKLGAVLLSEAARQDLDEDIENDGLNSPPSFALVSGLDGPIRKEIKGYRAYTRGQLYDPPDESPGAPPPFDPFAKTLPGGEGRRRYKPARGLALDGFPESLKRKRKG